MTTTADSKFRSRKFMISVFGLIVSSAALFTGHMADSQYVAALAFILGLYGAADVTEKRGVNK